MTDYYTQMDDARAMGREYAEAGISYGQTEPEDYPLSGEWAGAITVDDIVAALGADPECIENYEREDVADYWEDGYRSAAWPGN